MTSFVQLFFSIYYFIMYFFFQIPGPLNELYSMYDDPDRRLFLDKLIRYMNEKGKPIDRCPTISKQPLDIYRLYLTVKEMGGYVEVPVFLLF